MVIAVISGVFSGFTEEQGPEEDIVVTSLMTIKAVMTVKIQGDKLELFPYLSFALCYANTSRCLGCQHYSHSCSHSLHCLLHVASDN
jgi:hypothetical protein